MQIIYKKTPSHVLWFCLGIKYWKFWRFYLKVTKQLWVDVAQTFPDSHCRVANRVVHVAASHHYITNQISFPQWLTNYSLLIRKYPIPNQELLHLLSPKNSSVRISFKWNIVVRHQIHHLVHWSTPQLFIQTTSSGAAVIVKTFSAWTEKCLLNVSDSETAALRQPTTKIPISSIWIVDLYYEPTMSRKRFYNR